MTDAECVAFLHWALPRMGLRWRGFRKVRGQVRKRIARRMRELALPDAGAYRSHLESHPAEWSVLDALCRIPISRFSRDRHFFELLAGRVLPEAAATGEARIWSAGCASGEEPFTLAILLREQGLRGGIVATDADAHLLERARAGVYARSSLKELPPHLRARAFEAKGAAWRLRDAYRTGVRFAQQDIRTTAPSGRFALVLCRNLAFTYFDDRLQAEVLDRIRSRLEPGGLLAVGAHERLPPGARGWRRRSRWLYEATAPAG